MSWRETDRQTDREEVSNVFLPPINQDGNNRSEREDGTLCGEREGVGGGVTREKGETIRCKRSVCKLHHKYPR